MNEAAAVATKKWRRRLPVGAEVVPGDGVHFRVWAPRRKHVAVVLEPDTREIELWREPHGYFSGIVAEASAGTLYRYRLDDDAMLYPDPASRFQPQGPHGPSQVIDAETFVWTDRTWPGIAPENRILYELHVGTFTPEGTWASAESQLPELNELGISVIELMPVADFAGKFGWGYDGVNLFAPTRLYGAPDDFRRFVDRAHQVGLGVILDVVYNHLGPDGNYLSFFSDDYFTDRYQGDWGQPFNLDGPDAEPVREYILANVQYWIREFHLDGYRIDATQGIFDASAGTKHIVAEIARVARGAAPDRHTFLTAENEPQDTIHLRPAEHGGYGLDALWNDDWHHTAMVALTGRNEAYYTDYLGTPQEFVSSAKYGYLYQGQYYSWQDNTRGTPALDFTTESFIHYLQNHDQIANSARGERLHQLISPGRLRAFTALLLLGPATPMLFMGQEFAASAPFVYFADHKPELAKAVRQGRGKFLSQFASLAQPDVSSRLDEPADPKTFQKCALDLSERVRHAQIYSLHRDLIRLRREDVTLGRRGIHDFDGAVLGAEAFVLRFFGRAGGNDTADRLLLVNYGQSIKYSPAPEPLLAPPAWQRWDVLWSSDDPKYGGSGHPPPLSPEGNWLLPAECAVLLAPVSLAKHV